MQYNLSLSRILFILLILLSNGSVYGQRSNRQSSGVIMATEFHVTRPLREIFAEHPVDETKLYQNEESEDREHRKPQKFRFTVKDGPQYGNEEKSVQRTMGDVPPLPIRANWAGQTASGFRPFDPSGAVGPNHYVQMINSTTFKVYNKSSGAVLLTATLGNLWSPATANAGDPIVMYDKAADRWFLAQFGSANQIYIAVSQTNDPTGSYYTYTYTSPLFPDYLKFSVWADGYYMTSNQSTQKVFAFNRAEILAGTPGARSIYVNFSPPKSGFFVPLPGDAADGTLPPAGTPCPIFSYSDNGWGAGYSDAVNIYQMSVNWVPATPTATITLAGNLPTAAFDASYDASWNDCPQPNTAQKLDGIGGVFMYRAQFKSWTGYNTVVLNWGVKSSSTQRSIKWCELRQDQSTNSWSIYQEGIYRPDTTATRWMGSIAMDNNGSIGLSYIKSDPTSIFPGIYYTGRRSCDPLGTLPVIETMVVAGTGSQTGMNRVGDYSQTTLDMDGLTFWSTSEFMGGATGGSAATTRIFSYQIAPCGNNASVNITQTSGSNPQCPGASATFTATPFNGGSSPSYQWQVNGVNVGTNNPVYTTTSLTNGQTITCIMTSNLSGVIGSPATSNTIIMTVNAVTTPSVSIAITGGSNPTCPGVDLTFTATTVNAGSTPTYQWKLNGTNVGTNSPIYSNASFTNGQVVTCVITSSALCNTTTTATSNGITVSTTVTPTVTISQTAGANPFCAGSSVSFTATPVNAVSPAFQWKLDGVNVGTNSSVYTSSTITNGQILTCEVSSASACPVLVTLGSGSTTNTTTSDVGVAYPTYYGNGRQQYLIRASELTALGLTAGNISSLAFNINSTVGNPATLNGYTIKMGATTSTVMTAAFLTSTFTTVLAPTNYTPVLNSWNTHTFSTPFNWNGTSNIVIDICFSNSVVGTVSYQNFQTSSSFVSTTYYQADGTAGAGACTTTTTSGTGSIRPNMKFGKAGSSSVAISNAITMSVSNAQTPTVNISISGGTNPSCAGSPVTFTATPVNGGTPVYQWKVNGVNVGTNSPTYSSSSFTNGQVISCSMTSSLSCANPTTVTSNTITITINPSVAPTVSIAITGGSNPSCAGSPITFTATPVNGGTPVYQWQVNGVNVGTNSPTYSSSTFTNGQIVSCNMTSSLSCSNPTTISSNTITITINPSVVPTVAIAITGGSNPSCAGAPVTFTASPVNGGIPVYQWQVNGVNVGTNSPTFSSSAFTNGQVISCNMTSSLSCANPTATTSNTITITINPSVVPAVSIAMTGGTNPSCSGSAITFTATGTNGGTPSYQWKINGVNAGSNSAIFSSSTLTNGQIISCDMTSTQACATPALVSSNNITMSINPILTPTVSIAITSGNNPSCSGIPISFTATSTNGGTPNYQWKVDGINAGTNSANFSTGSLTNGQIVTCNLSSSATCASPSTVSSNAITLTINPTVVPSVSIGITNGSNPSCAGTSVTFSAIPVNGGTPSYQWKINGVNTGTNSPTFSTSTLTNGQNVTCVITSTASCVSPSTATSNTISMTINPIIIPSVSISITNGSNPSCIGAPITFIATPNNGGSPSYQWKVNGINVGTNNQQFSSSNFNNGDVVNCFMTSTVACTSPTIVPSNNVTLVINPLPLVTIGNVNGCSGIPLPLTGTPSGGIFSVSNPYLGASTNYSYTYTDNNGCTATSSPASITIHSASINASQSNTACDSYIWPINGQTYTATGTYSTSFVNVWGCDSSYTLNLTILYSNNSTISITANNTFTWAANGNTYSNSGVYTATLVNNQGCDSILTLNLTINIPSQGLSISPKVMLAGPYNSFVGLMNDSLRINNLIPLTEPYSTAPLNFPQISYPGGETVSPAVLSIIGNNAIVDWIFLELRSANNPTLIVATKRALLQRDGDIVSAADGVSPVVFTNELSGDYYFSVKHRNHLGVMTATPITLSSTPTVIDFSNESPVWVNPLISNPPRKVDGNLRLLYVGDANANKTVKYNGFSNDKDQVLNTVGPSSPNNIVPGYRLEDVNMDSKVKYNSTDNDRTVILNSVGSGTPNSILFQHTPN